MDQTEIIQHILEWQNLLVRVKGVERLNEPALLDMMNSKPIKIITGFRRSGKSFLVQRVARKLIEKNDVSLTNVLFLNFEDFELSEINTAKKLNDVIRLFFRDISEEGKKLLIFDEIQKVADWDKLVRTLYEKNDDCEIVITGSNSELLSSELGSNLAGRFIETEILPFDFKEYLTYKGLAISSLKAYMRNREKIRGLFSKYVKYGGLPEIFSIDSDHASFSYLEGVLSKVILDDIIKRFRIKNGFVIEKIILYIFSSVGNNISFKRIAGFLNQMGLTLKMETLINYVQYALKTFAIFETNKFDWKMSKLFSVTRKYYAVDTGFINYCTSQSRNYSRQLENIVYLKLRQQTRKIYFGELENGKEIDFITESQEGIYHKYQVSQTIHDNNYEREVVPFTLGDKHLLDHENTLLTLDDDEGEFDYKKIRITKKNLIKWLLDIS